MPTLRMPAEKAPMEAWSRPVVGPPDDDAERIADRMANGVMSTSSPTTNLTGGLARFSTSVAGDDAPDLVGDMMRSSGQPLDSGVRAVFEPRFGHDFSQVRVHAGESARHSARAIGARAYTVGSHIVLAEGSLGPSPLMAHELAHVVVESRGYALGARPVVRRQTGPEPPVQAGSNFTAEEAALLRLARSTLQPKGNAIVGVLIPQGGKPIFLQSGGGQGFSSHIEGKATTVMRDQGITRAKLIVELEPCQICDRSTYPGPDVPTGGVTGTASGKQIPLQTSKINTAMPTGTKLNVVGPESTGIYEGVGPKVTPKTPAVPRVSDLHPDPRPARTAPPTTTAPPPALKATIQAEEPHAAIAPAPKVAPRQPGLPAEQPPIAGPGGLAASSPGWRLKAGLKAGATAAVWMIAFAALDYYVHRKLAEQLESDIDRARRVEHSYAAYVKANQPEQYPGPIYFTVTVHSEEYSRYIPLVGWTPESPVLEIWSAGITTTPVEPPIVTVDDHSLDLLRPGKTTKVTYTELLIP